MTERTRRFLAEVEGEADLAPGMLSRRFLPMFAADETRLASVPDADLPRLKAHLLAAHDGGPQRSVDAGAAMSPAEIQYFRHLFKRVGRAIAADAALDPEGKAAVRALCPYCDEEGPIEPDPVDVAARPALPGTAGALRPGGGEDER